MKNLKGTLVLIASFLMFGFSAVAQEEEIVEAVFAEFDGANYNFSFTDVGGEEMYIVFSNINPDVEELFDLKGDDLKGQRFLITYKEENRTEESDGETLEYNENTIIDLQKQ